MQPVWIALAGSPLGQQVTGGQVIYTLRPPWSSLVTERGVAQRIWTHAGECRTLRHVGPGSAAAAVRQAYADASVSGVTPTAEGDLLSYPFIGIAFLLRGERVAAIEVFRPEGKPPGHRRPMQKSGHSTPQATRSRQATVPCILTLSPAVGRRPSRRG